MVNHTSQVTPGALFVCIPGYRHDGHLYFREAEGKGAAAFITERRLETPLPQLIVQNSRLAQALACQQFYNLPSEKFKLVGITGTNGKTTISFLTEQILQAAGLKTGLIGTVNYKYDHVMLPASHTTPDAPELAQIFHRMVNNKVDAAVMEVSSHALALERVTGCDFDVAVFSNISRDHFDFHKSFDHYLKAKAKLFARQCSWGSTPAHQRFAVINIDDPHSSQILKSTSAPNVISYGFKAGAQVRVMQYSLGKRSSELALKVNNRGLSLTLPLPGFFNIYNALAAVAIALCFEIEPALAARALTTFQGVPGRFEFIECGQDFDVIVDFAHNPSALYNILSLEGQRGSARKIVVFGCEGGKDRGKRSLMGSIAAKYADYTIITSDNIFAEKPMDIALDVAGGIIKEGKKASPYEIIVNRYKAIQRALELARPGDLVIVAGKGHETRKIIYNQAIPFDDRQVVKEILQTRLVAYQPGSNLKGTPGLA